MGDSIFFRESVRGTFFCVLFRRLKTVFRRFKTLGIIPGVALLPRCSGGINSRVGRFYPAQSGDKTVAPKSGSDQLSHDLRAYRQSRLRCLSLNAVGRFHGSLVNATVR